WPQRGARGGAPSADRGDGPRSDRPPQRRPRRAFAQLHRGGTGERVPPGPRGLRARGPQALHRGVACGGCVARAAGRGERCGRYRTGPRPRRRRARGAPHRDPRGPQALHRGRCDGETLRMTALLVDLGNTRIKWARFDGERLSAPRAAAHSGWRAADYGRRLFGGKAPPGSMLVASVAGARLDRRPGAAARRAAVRARFVTAPPRPARATARYP